MPSPADQAMQTLTSQWYNALTAQLHLDPSQFQMVQGNVALGSTSLQLWALMDSIPPYSITQYWTPNGYNAFSAQYGLLIPRLQDPSYGQFQSTMGDYYQSWMTYLQKNPPPTGTTIAAYFSSWAYLNMAPDKATTCISLFNAAMNGVVGNANSIWTAAGGPTGVKAYNQSMDSVSNIIAKAPSGSVTLNTSTQSSDTTHTWASGSVDGFWDVFFGSAGASYDNATSLVTAAGFNLSVQFSHVATVPIIPLSQGSVVAGPTTYNAWYVPGAASMGYSNNNYQVWQPGTPGWTSFFGDGGSWPRGASSMIIVDGITVTMTSNNSISSSDQTQVQTAFEAGFFPFFGVKGQGGWSSQQSFSSNGTITATSSSPVGSPQVLGILQSPIGTLIASQDAQVQALAGVVQ